MSPTLTLLRLGETGDRSDEDNLIRRAQDGDAEAFARLYRRYRHYLHTICTQRLRDPALAEDVVQETFIRAYRALPRFESGRRLLPWLATIALRRCSTAYERRAKRKTEATDPHDELFLERHTVKEPFDEVIAIEQRRHLERALATLPPRQRRALLLYAIEDWSYVDIASAEGSSVSTVKSLIWRARDGLRKACESGLLGTVVFPLRRLFRRLAARPGGAESPASAVAAVIGAQQVGALIATLSLLMGVPHASTGADWTATEVEKVAAFQPSQAATPAPAIDDRRPSEPAPAGIDLRRWRKPKTPYVTGPVNHTHYTLFPQEYQHPDSVRMTSMVASPTYDRDHTIFASGICWGSYQCRVLFTSRDGGANWTRLPAHGYAGESLLLPPTYPADDRIFAMGLAGLQVSEDGGKSFRVASPFRGTAAMSPAFSAGDPRILILTAEPSTLIEYGADTGRSAPSKLSLPPGLYDNLSLPPTYPADGSVFFTGQDLKESSTTTLGMAPGPFLEMAPSPFPRDSKRFTAQHGDPLSGHQEPDRAGLILNQCQDDACERLVLPGEWGVSSPWFSPRFEEDRTMYLGTTGRILAVRDGRRVAQIPDPEAIQASIFAFSASAGSSGPPTMWVAGLSSSTYRQPGEPASGLYRSTDGGRHWLDLGVEDVYYLFPMPGGRLLAGMSFGLACSEDGGLTWASRCSAE